MAILTEISILLMKTCLTILSPQERDACQYNHISQIEQPLVGSSIWAPKSPVFSEGGNRGAWAQNLRPSLQSHVTCLTIFCWQGMQHQSFPVVGWSWPFTAGLLWTANYLSTHQRRRLPDTLTTPYMWDSSKHMIPFSLLKCQLG